ncbi:MAG: helicase C-terminal domain-containing protein [Bacillota bacterium]
MRKAEAWQPPTMRYYGEKAMVDFFVKLLEDRLAGRHEKRIVNRVPVDHCHLGVLGPWRRQVDEVDLLEDDEESGAGTISIDGPATQKMENGPTEAFTLPVAEEAVENRKTADAEEDREYTRRPPSSLGFEIRVKPEGDKVEIEVDVRFAVYTRHLPTLQEQLTSLGGSLEAQTTEDGMTLAEVCQRHEVIVPGIRFRLPANHRIVLHDKGRVQHVLNQVLNEATDSSDAMPAFPQIPKVPSRALKDEAGFQAWLNDRAHGFSRIRPPLQARLEVRAEPQPDGTVRFSAYLRNDTPRAELRGGKRSEDNYNILGDARLHARLLKGELQPVEILPIPEDYQYDRRVWGVGHNTSVVVKEEDRRELYTQALARYEQLRLTTRDEPPALFEELAEDPLKILEQIRLSMEDYAKEWHREVITNNLLNLEPTALAKCQEDLQTFREEINRFTCGIAAMVKDPKLRLAFQGMNRVMGRMAQAKGFKSWRLFQMIFIVTQLPALALRAGHTEGEWPEGVKRSWNDHLDTADVLWFPTGGGKTEAYLGLISCAILYDRLRGKKLGVTAWLRLPLRMLSLQQLQRAMHMIWETEKERRELLGEKAYDSDPIRLGYFVGNPPTPNILWPGDMDKYKDPATLEPLRVVPDCPNCGKSMVEVQPDPLRLRFRHVCTNCQTELPLVVTDSEVYRYLPALLVGTVDKMATVGLQYLFGILWAGPRWRCPVHGYGYGEYCVKDCTANRQPVEPLDPAPSLHIQDELHLLQEELGAFAGHYETLIRFCEEKASRLPAKVVAATATIEGFEYQVRHLYGVKRARRFPGRGYQLYENFYITPERDPESDQPKVQRIFVAFRPSSGNAADAAARCAQILHEAIAGMIRNPYQALAAIPGLHSVEEFQKLLFYYSATLTYVGNLQAGTRVRDYLQEAGSEVFEGLRDLNVEYLNSRSTSGQVAEVIHRMEQPPTWEDCNHLDAVVATSMISHGVDLERINLMIMDRFPAEIAEYIQASSRSGRKKVGLVTVVLPGYSLRAISIYNRFKEFHAHLNRMVTPVPVNRFAKYAVHRTIPGIISGLMFGYVGPLCKDHRAVNRVRRRDYALSQLINNKQAFLQALKEAYRLGRGVYDPDLEQAMAEAIHQRYEEILLVLRSSHERDLTAALKPRPMRSLRDVEAGVPFFPRHGDPLFLMWFRKDGE